MIWGYPYFWKHPISVIHLFQPLIFTGHSLVFRGHSDNLNPKYTWPVAVRTLLHLGHRFKWYVVYKKVYDFDHHDNPYITEYYNHILRIQSVTCSKCLSVFWSLHNCRSAGLRNDQRYNVRLSWNLVVFAGWNPPLRWSLMSSVTHRTEKPRHHPQTNCDICSFTLQNGEFGRYGINYRYNFLF